jgi:hypothetical protein
MDESYLRTAGPVRPHLWNPNAAAWWSLLLTPAFGAYLHASNWQALGKPERAATNMVWVWGIVAFYGVVIVTVFLPDSKVIDGVMRSAGLGLLIGWYFSQGRPQARYVKESLGDDYVKKSWGLPLLAGAAAFSGYLVVIFIMAVASYKPDPNELAAAVKPLILQEWQKKPELIGAKINNITLVHKGGNTYTGFVDATFGGKSQQLALEVTHDGQNTMWQVKPLGN